MRPLHALVAVGFTLLSGVALAGPQAPAKAVPLFSISANLAAGPVVLRGTLGEAQVQVNLRQKPGGEQGVEGDYFVFGASQKILLAGEYEAQEFSFEESINGVDVSGSWYGTVDGDTLNGTWESVDGKISKPFALRLIRQDGARTAASKQGANKPLGTGKHE
jgi:hypothetical protein